MVESIVLFLNDEGFVHHILSVSIGTKKESKVKQRDYYQKHILSRII